MARKKPTAPPLPLAKRLAFGAILTLSPLLFFFFLEFSFMFLGLGYDPAPLIRPPRLPNYYVTNPDYLRRFQTSDGQRELSGSVLIPVKKTPGTYRIFILGESTPQGFPFFKNQAFGPAAGRILEAAWGTPVEVINLGATATTSFYVADLAPRLLEYDPDLLVIYSGHNEYYGYQSIADGSSPELQRLGLWLRQFRVVQVVTEALRPPIGPSSNMMQRQFAGREYPPEQARDLRVNETFIENLQRAISPWLAQGRQVLLMEPVSNLTDMPPFGSTAPFDQSLQSLEELIAAKDADTLPFRARSGLTQSLNKFLESPDLPREVSFFKTSELLKEASHNPFSFEFFVEHVHFNQEGHLLVAQELAQAIALLSGRPISESQTGLSPNPLYMTALTQARAYKAIEILIQQFPFSQVKPELAPPFTAWLFTNHFFRDEDFWRQFEVTNYYQQGVQWLRQAGHLRELFDELKNNVLLFPAEPRVYSELSRVLRADQQYGQADQLDAFARQLEF